MTSLEALKQHTTVVADTGDFKSMARFAPRDATTNPSLILKAVQSPEYVHLVSETLEQHGGKPLDAVADAVLVRFGLEILKVVPGRVSTEVDARLSFDSAGSVSRARRIIGMYEDAGIARERILIKLASTWEGIQAARVLEQEGIRCNLTLLFSLCQAVACADAGVTLISPFVGRIYDWYKKAAGAQWNEEAHRGSADPGVRSVARIYAYYKKFGIATEVMGASFRNTGQILALAGCDLLTISPELLAELQAIDSPVPRVLDPQQAQRSEIDALHYDEAGFRHALNEDAMATEKLAEGIRNFVADAGKMDGLIAKLKQ